MHHKTKEMLRNALLAQLEESGGSAGNKALREAMEAALGREVSQEDYDEVKEELVAEGLLGRGKGKGGSVYLAAADDDEDAGEDFSLAVQEAPEPSEAKPRKAKAAAPGGPANQPNQVLAYRHDEKRKNNPHVGMVDVASDHEESETTWAYDPHIDPALQFDPQRAGIEALIDDALASGDAAQMRAALEELKRMQSPYLNWAGKAERTSFEVDTVSLHVHERIDPATILAAVQKRIKDSKGKTVGGFQPDMFHAPFENLPLSQAIDFYKHDRDWANRLIAGDSLLVMNSLLQKEGMAGQVQMIYIDPPYGIKYGSNFQPFTNKRDVKDRKDEDLTQEPEMIKAFRDTWELGIHSYLTYLRDRLLLAKELLHESGSVFVQISDENLHHTKEILDEVFGVTNSVSVITVRKTGAVSSPDARLNSLATIGDFILWYAKNKKEIKYKQLFLDKFDNGSAESQYRLQDEVGAYQSVTIESNGYADKFHYPVFIGGREFRPASTRHWSTTENGIYRAEKAGRVLVTPGKLRFKKYLEDFPVSPIANIWTDMMGAGGLIYVVQTNEKIIERCMLMTTDPGDLVLDPTCGSGTTAYVAEKWGRRWITCDTSRVAITLAKQRLMTASFDYFALRYPNEGLRGGFIYKTVPHVTLKSIANNAEIDAIYERMHPAIASALAALNAALKTHAPATPYPVTEGARKGQKLVLGLQGQDLQEWEVPFDLPADWAAELQAPLAQFHTARQKMQAEMDRSIAAHADSETLYDQPERDKAKLRVCGPFTVEAVPFPTVLSLEELPAQAGQAPGPDLADMSIARSGHTSRQHAWRDELLKTGIRGKGGQMLRFAELEVLPGTTSVHASGSLDTGERVVVSFGPEHGALEQRQVERALNEAGELFPRPKMIVFCAFAFDPEAAKDIDALKGITALKAQMNTDLLTEDLKKARSSNQSFWLMGQPDVLLTALPDDLWQVEVNGFDYFDTAKGELVSGGKAKIAAWQLDTDYDGRSLFPHQVFFPMAGKDEGWMKLKKDIRAELDADLLQAFTGTVSLPFAAGDNRMVAVKIVDDRGIESLKVMRLDGTPTPAA